jgi:hypothetical protein
MSSPFGPLSETNCPCLTKVSTTFVFNNLQYQASANTVYIQASTFNSSSQATATGNYFPFKTDYQRMQYLIGKFAAYQANR